jgi:LURP-one-related
MPSLYKRRLEDFIILLLLLSALSTMANLASYPHPLGVLPQFNAQQPTTLVLKEKVLSLTGDDFHIKTVDGVDILRVKGVVASLSGRKKVSDPQGNLLFSIRAEHFSIPKSYYLENPQGQKFLTVEGKWSRKHCQCSVF